MECRYWTSARRVVRSSTSSRNGFGDVRAGEEAVVGEEQPVLGIPQAHQSRRVSRQVQDVELDLARAELLALGQRLDPGRIDAAAVLPAVCPMATRRGTWSVGTPCRRR